MKVVKYFLLLLVLIVVALVAIAYFKPSVITKSALKPVIEYRCELEIKETKIWKTASLFLMEDDQKQAVANVCGCVSEHATDEVMPNEILKALMSEEAKNQLTSKVIANSIRGCAKDLFLKQL